MSCPLARIIHTLIDLRSSCLEMVQMCRLARMHRHPGKYEASEPASGRSAGPVDLNSLYQWHRIRDCTEFKFERIVPDAGRFAGLEGFCPEAFWCDSVVGLAGKGMKPGDPWRRPTPSSAVMVDVMIDPRWTRGGARTHGHQRSLSGRKPLLSTSEHRRPP